MFKLYYAPGTCALASHIALEEAGAAYTTERLDFKSNQQNSPEYLKINPKGRVPALVTDRGVLTETPAMLAYIAQSFPQAKARAARRRLCVRAGAGLQQLSLLHRACRACPQGARLPLGDRRILLRRHEAHGAEDHGACFALIERDMLKGPWVMGEQLHDLRSLSLHARRLARRRRRRCLRHLPKVLAHRQRMAAAAGGEEGDGGREALRQIRSRPGLEPGRRTEVAYAALRLRRCSISRPVAEHQRCAARSSRVHLGAGRIEHELLVDPGIERRRRPSPATIASPARRSGGAARRRRGRCAR